MINFGVKDGCEAAAKKLTAAAESLEGDKYANDCPVFKEVVASFKAKFPFWDLSHMKLVISASPRNHDGDVVTDEDKIKKYTGSWTKLDTIYISPDMKRAMEFYGTTDRTTEEDMYKQAIAHELCHEIWKYQLCGDCKDGFLQKAKDLKFDTPYLHHIDDDDPDEELFCEYLAYRVTDVWIKV